MKIGILAQYLDTRNDIRDLIIEMRNHIDVCVFVHARDMVYSRLLPGIEFREIKVRSKSSLWNGLIKYLFLFFGEIPASNKNYFFAERTKLKHGGHSFFKILEKHLSIMMTRVLAVLSYDAYLKVLWYKNETLIDDIDAYLGITEIYDDRFLSALLKNNKPVSLYVYSWDHPCKMKTFPKKIEQYFVWNEGLRQDLISLQNVPGEKIRNIGATQLSYIPDYKDSCQNPVGFSYYYFGCAFGYKELVDEEINFVRQIAAEMERIEPTMKLVVRPYPFLRDWAMYDSLKQLPNIYMDDQFRNSQDKFFLTKDEIFRKFHWIANADAFIHFGTTMGMEASYFETPVIHINYGHTKTFEDLLHQYHTLKYLILPDFPNIVNSEEELKVVLRHLKTSRSDFLPYNEVVAAQTSLRTMREIVADLVSKLHVN